MWLAKEPIRLLINYTKEARNQGAWATQKASVKQEKALLMPL